MTHPRQHLHEGLFQHQLRDRTARALALPSALGIPAPPDVITLLSAPRLTGNRAPAYELRSAVGAVELRGEHGAVAVVLVLTRFCGGRAVPGWKIG